MNQEKQRIAIAQACGWTKIGYHEQEITGRKPTNGFYEIIPDYLNDLNAMREAEQILWRMDWSHRYAFNDHLANTIRGRTVNRNEWNAETLLDATASQRAEAFLRTLGKWEEK